MPHPPLVARAPGTDTPLRVRIDDHTLVAAAPGETVAAALLAAGRLATSRSAKYRRPRGPFCLTGDCGTCLLRVDGRPNIRACTTLVRDGMQLHSQNALGPVALDPSRLFDPLLGHGMEHHHFFVRPKIVNRVMQDVARELTGFGHLPDRPSTTQAELVELDPAAVVIGSGPAGRAALSRLHERGVEAIGLERAEAELVAADLGAVPPGWRCAAAVFGIYPAEGLVAAVQRRDPSGTALLRLRPRHVILATGTHESTLAVANNDLPGVMSGRGLLRLLARSRMTIRGPLVVIGSGDEAEAIGRTLGAHAVVAPDDVVAIRGRHRVEGVALRGREIACNVVAMVAEPAPAFELGAQAGAETVRFAGGFAIATDDDGRCRSRGPWTLWACGAVRGEPDRERAAVDGTRVADAVGSAIEEEARA